MSQIDTPIPGHTSDEEPPLLMEETMPHEAALLEQSLPGSAEKGPLGSPAPAAQTASETDAEIKPHDGENTSGAHVPVNRLNLNIGTRLQLITYGATKKEYYSSLIGYEAGKYLLIKMPQVGGFSAPLQETETVEIRMFTGISIHIFTTCVQHIYQRPRQLVELAYPAKLQVMPLRKDIRITISLPVKVRSENMVEAVDALALDLSSTGIMLQSESAPGAIGASITLSFVIPAKGNQEEKSIECKAVVRNTRTALNGAGDALYNYGAMFEELSPDAQQSLQNFMNEVILDRRQG